MYYKNHTTGTINHTHTSIFTSHEKHKLQNFKNMMVVFIIIYAICLHFKLPLKNEEKSPLALTKLSLTLHYS